MSGLIQMTVFTVFFALNAWPEEAPLPSSYEFCMLTMKPMSECNTVNKTSPLQDMRIATCELRSKTYRCAEQRALATDEEKSAYLDCSRSDHVCEQISSSAVSKLFECGQGAGGVLVDSVLGVIYLPKSIFNLVTARADLPQAFRSCYEDRDFKLIVLGELKPASMTEETFANMSCFDALRFARTKSEVILQRLESRRQNQIASTGEEVRYEEMKLSETELQALAYDQTHRGMPGYRCLRPEVAARKVCERLSNVGLTASGLTAPATIGAGARLIRSFNSSDLVGAVGKTGLAEFTGFKRLQEAASIQILALRNRVSGAIFRAPKIDPAILRSTYKESELKFETKGLSSYGEDKLNALRAEETSMGLQFLKTPKERAPYQVYVHEGRIYDAQGRPITTGQKWHVKYVMDRNGNIFMGPFHHPGFLNWDDVAAAGTLEINNGLIGRVSRSSGQYAPESKHLQQFRNRLTEMAADLRTAHFDDVGLWD